MAQTNDTLAGLLGSNMAITAQLTIKAALVGGVLGWGLGYSIAPLTAVQAPVAVVNGQKMVLNYPAMPPSGSQALQTVDTLKQQLGQTPTMALSTAQADALAYAWGIDNATHQRRYERTGLIWAGAASGGITATFGAIKCVMIALNARRRTHAPAR